MERLRTADAPAAASALEEILRWTTPTIFKRRTATRDVDYKGHQIKEGDKVTYWEMSANRDEGVFKEPFRFDIARSPNQHLAFGFGTHVCLGASLARMEMRIAFQELLARIDTFKPEGRSTGCREPPARHPAHAAQHPPAGQPSLALTPRSGKDRVASSVDGRTRFSWIRIKRHRPGDRSHGDGRGRHHGPDHQPRLRACGDHKLVVVRGPRPQDPLLQFSVAPAGAGAS